MKIPKKSPILIQIKYLLLLDLFFLTNWYFQKRARERERILQFVSFSDWNAAHLLPTAQKNKQNKHKFHKQKIVS